MMLFMGILCVLLGVINIFIATSPFGYIVSGWCLAVGFLDIVKYLVEYFEKRR